ncbi:methyl-accepting chemotaxis protein [Gammaproteobacteria bacterium AB-CW1]|uniref:Methyl-accepting chemotaxis protein n=1 Tax=Natronospira elongata TaxID=3110268 RepID=A0AAP6ML17_9GAMM|nr:methyl-accepting chemotaxis protein [Gammaproteobacteria bacterium AB-CW1]
MNEAGGVLEFFLPVGRRLSAEQRTQALNLTGISLALGVAGLFFTLRYYLLGMPLGSLGVLIASLIALCCPLVLKLSGSIAAARLLALGTLNALLFWLCFVAAGVMSSPVFWFAVVPVAAIFTGGWRHGYLWTPIAAATVILLHLGEQGGWLLPLDHLPEEAVRPMQISSSLVLLVVMAILALLFERARRRGVAELEQVSADLASAGSHMADRSRSIGTEASAVAELLSEQEENRRKIESLLAELTDVAERAFGEAQQMAQGAARAETRAGDGGRLAHATVEELEALNRTVRESGEELRKLASGTRSLMKVVELIDNIARQTHRLALNASIEAARAGAEGRSFGVVAEEVRALAERSQEAAHEIGDRIDRLVHGVEDGSSGMQRAAEVMESSRHQASEADLALGEIVETARQLAEQSRNVAEATERQRAAERSLRAWFQQLGERLEHISASSGRIDQAANEVGAALDTLERGLGRKQSDAGEKR